MSWKSVDLPLPDTPVTQINLAKDIYIISFKLNSLAPSMEIFGRCLPRFLALQ